MAYSLEEMEAYLSEIYSVAAKDLEKTARQYLKDFERLQKQNQKKVDNGKWTQEEYDTWRKNKLLYGEHWPRIIQKVQREMLKVNQTALDYVNGKVPQIFAHTYNEVANKIPKSPVSGYSFELVNSETVNKLVKEEGIMLPPKKNLDKQKDKLWNAKQLNAQILQGVLTGESIPKLAERVKVVVGNNEVAAVRTARTMCTAAENSGRQSAYNKAEADGIKLNKTWLSAYMQANTRDTHRELNEQTVRSNEMFLTFKGNELEFPGDWRAPGYEVYNCRCTMVTSVIGFDKDKLKESVERQKKEREAIQKAQQKQETVEQQIIEEQTVENLSYVDDINNIRDRFNAETDPAERDRLLQEAGTIMFDRIISENIGTAGKIKECNAEIASLSAELREIDKILSPLVKEQYFLQKKLMLYPSDEERERIKKRLKEISEISAVNQPRKDEINKLLYNLRREVTQERINNTEKLALYARSMLAEIRECGTTRQNEFVVSGTNVTVAKECTDIVKESLGYYPTAWIEAVLSNGRGALSCYSVSRGSYEYYGNRINISGDDYKEKMSTAVHELGHCYESNIKSILDAEAYFYERRTKGERLKWLGAPYKKSEKGREDNFLDSYIGKDYGGEAYEVVSMGFDFYFNETDKILDDEDYSKFIMGVLALC